MLFNKQIIYSSLFQVILMGVICFCLPGIFAALNALGGGGQIDPSTGSKANTALYTTLAIFGLLGGTTINLFGVTMTLFLGSFFYVLYTCSYVYYNQTQQSYFTITAGGLLGIASGTLWTGQGMIMTSYPLPHQRGKFISIVWSIYSLGGVIGSAIPLIFGLGNKALPNSGYFAFGAIQLVGGFLCLLLVHPSKVIKSDGSRVITEQKRKTLSEIFQTFILFKDKRMLCFTVIAFSTNFFYAYIFNHYNLSNFTTNSKGFNNLIFYSCEILGSNIISRFFDLNISKRKKGFIGSLSIYVLLNIAWALMYFQQKHIGNLRENSDFLVFNYKTSKTAYIYPCFIYAVFGILDSFYQTYAYWIIGSIGTSSNTLSRCVGFFKFFQSIATATSYAIDSAKVKANTQLFINWAILISVLPSMLYLSSQIKDLEPVYLSKSPSIVDLEDADADVKPTSRA
ncbi:hypothetical protein BB561_003476 [Smittium simulii]|uniref:Major facilitator superfamily (MFS) profile domain-containing protein n=1 Tax=Smittium simulii TaxID=133385 RepID=A0A2T9YL60_9FUNG|nr:hypothetical protein BB561_003476 [Smittium simulii]